MQTHSSMIVPYTFRVLYSNKVGLLRNKEYVYGGFPEMIVQQEIFHQALESYSHYVQKPKDRLTEIHNTGGYGFSHILMAHVRTLESQKEISVTQSAVSNLISKSS